MNWEIINSRLENVYDLSCNIFLYCNKNNTKNSNVNPKLFTKCVAFYKFYNGKFTATVSGLLWDKNKQDRSGVLKCESWQKIEEEVEVFNRFLVMFFSFSYNKQTNSTFNVFFGERKIMEFFHKYTFSGFSYQKQTFIVKG